MCRAHTPASLLSGSFTWVSVSISGGEFPAPSTTDGLQDLPYHNTDGYKPYLQLGDDLIMMGRPASGYRNPKRLGQATQHLYVNVEDVDKHFDRARKTGATILEQPAHRRVIRLAVGPNIRAPYFRNPNALAKHLHARDKV